MVVFIKYGVERRSAELVKCWKWADFYSFYFLKLNLLYVVGCSVQTKKLINTNVRISEKKAVVVYVISD